MLDPQMCKRCGETRSDDHFPVNKGRKDYSRCRPCRNDYYREYRKRNPESTALAARRVKLRVYNLTIEQYDAMLEAQGGVCASCGKPPVENCLAVDHDHACCPRARSCGRCVRGLLCVRCNVGLGYYEDAELMRNLAEYLKCGEP